MGLFDRLSTLLRSNINDLISSAENPEKMLNQILVDMRSQLAKAKQQVAAAIADEKRLREAFKNSRTDSVGITVDGFVRIGDVARFMYALELTNGRSAMPGHVSVFGSDQLKGAANLHLALDITTRAIIDVTGGRKDLTAETIRMVSAAAFWNDPVRLIRAFR